MKRIISVSIALWWILSIFSYAFAQIKEEEREVLRGLEGVRVEVERLKPEIERDGLYIDTLQGDVELKLRIAGIKVLSEEEGPQAPGAPYLFLVVDARKHRKGYIYKIELSLKEIVTSVRTGLTNIATTLTVHHEFGNTSYLSDIRDQANDLVDEFINAWQEANPK
jgi:hypothetical protein